MSLDELFVSKIRALDISPTQFKLASERYESVASFLVENGIDCDIYPQGSVALGTIVKPYRADRDQSFDIDMICKLNVEKNQASPRRIRENIGACLSDYAIGMKTPMTVDDRCFTLNYAETAGLEFKLDIVPAVPESYLTISSIMAQGVDYEKAKMAIAIIESKPKCTEDDWIPSNPSGYKLWFDEINMPFQMAAREQERRRIFEGSRNIYASIQEVPSQLERSALQRTIQILKRHRDVYYCRAKKENNKPASAVITTLAAQAATHVFANCNLLQCLEQVVAAIIKSEELLSSAQQAILSVDKTTFLLNHSDGKWVLRNPANPADNLTDSWDADTAQYFFRWLRAVENDFLKAGSLTDVQQERRILSALGLPLTMQDQQKADKNLTAPYSVKPIKPWGKS